ncbi:hypothetical protein [Frateuria sp. Soil773]|uniref:hypothetical protein n=1 Tax=Frateuria sp. Soil773 TaxID=1736407 RepID=UPI0012F952C2|nr:hypothetical protein [Frateuria sp. Soil773]
MNRKGLWIIARTLLVGINVAIFPLLLNKRTNFTIVAGLICGVILLPVIRFWLRKNPSQEQRFMAFDTPFWPMTRFPRAYWFTMGSSVAFSAVVSLVTHADEMVAIQLFGGLTIVGLSIVASVLSLGGRSPK